MSALTPEQRAELRKDKKRLDWIQKSGSLPYEKFLVGHWRHVDAEPDDEDYPTVRAAIDAAMEGK